MTNTRGLLFTVGALLATLLTRPTAAEEPQMSSSGSSKGMSPSHPRYASGYLAIGEDFYNGDATKAETEARVREMHRNRAARQKDHREGLVTRWGGRVLSHPKAREALQLNARREAYIARALFLAHTDESVKNRAALVERITKISDDEEERYSAVMESFKAELDATPPASPGGK
jgi:hypothetical protein